MVVFVLIFAIGSFMVGLNKQGAGLDAYTVITFVVWGVGLAGLILAWRNERLGVFISLAGFVVFNILAAVNPNPDSSYTFVLLLFDSFGIVCFMLVVRGENSVQLTGRVVVDS